MKRGAAPIRVVIADDHTIVLEGLKAVLARTADDIVVVGEARDGNQALRLAQRIAVDVYVLDITMPYLNGLEVMGRLLRRDKKARVVILSMHEDRLTVEKALRAGARGYLIKESAADEIGGALRAVHRGQYFLSATVSDSVAALLDPAQSESKILDSQPLTSKEREIIQLIAEGLGHKQIAYRLKISPNTVHVHRHNISLKLDIHKQTDLVRYAIKEGMAKL